MFDLAIKRRGLEPCAKSSTVSRPATPQLDLRKLRDQYLSDLSVFVEHCMRTPTFLAALRLSIVLSTHRQALWKWRPLASFRLQQLRP